jgi:hypothetical protein
MIDPTFSVGDAVVKISGYPFPGEIRSIFTTKAGNVLYVVEATGAGYAGMLHIFNGEQLHYADIAEAFDADG